MARKSKAKFQMKGHSIPGVKGFKGTALKDGRAASSAFQQIEMPDKIEDMDDSELFLIGKTKDEDGNIVDIKWAPTPDFSELDRFKRDEDESEVDPDLEGVEESFIDGALISGGSATPMKSPLEHRFRVSQLAQSQGEPLHDASSHPHPGEGKSSVDEEGTKIYKHVGGPTADADYRKGTWTSETEFVPGERKKEMEGSPTKMKSPLEHSMVNKKDNTLISKHDKNAHPHRGYASERMRKSIDKGYADLAGGPKQDRYAMGTWTGPNAWEADPPTKMKSALKHTGSATHPTEAIAAHKGHMTKTIEKLKKFQKNIKYPGSKKDK